jgi:hypothetical protein
VPKDSGVYGIPYPITFVVDPSGKVLSKHFEPDYKERETAGSVLSRHLNVRTGLAESAVETKHLKLTASASNTVIRPNQHIRLRLDIEMKPRMHVYAPGVVGYKPISWQIQPSEAFTVRAPAYPQSKLLHLPAIKETVPVYDGTFDIQTEVVLGSDALLKKVLDANNQLRITGSFVYQACDDTTCYVPQTIPLTWTLQFEPLDRERAPAELQHKLGR